MAFLRKACHMRGVDGDQVTNSEESKGLLVARDHDDNAHAHDHSWSWHGHFPMDKKQ